MHNKFNLVKLDSVGANTVGGPEAGAISLIYSFLLNLYQPDKYKHIFVNHVHKGLDEFVMKQPRDKIFVNIRYPIFEDFDTKGKDEKNRIRLDIIHEALLRIADEESKLEVDKLESIKNEILQNNFSYSFVVKSFKNKKNQSLKASIIIQPEMDRFDYFVSIEEFEKEKCKVLIYNGVTTLYFFDDFFNEGKWKNENELIISGKEKQVEIQISVDTCRVTYRNLTPYPKPPLFEMQKAFIPKEDKERAYKDWLHSLPPAKAAMLRQSHN